MTSAVVSHDQASLSLLVRQAANTLAGAETAAQVLDARDKAGLAYDTAKTAARLQKARRAHDDVINATYRVQADALEIEAEAKSRLADEYAAAQKRGEVAGHGGKRTGQEGNSKATIKEIGLSSKEIFHAHQLRNAIAVRPGIVRQVLDDILLTGAEPTRAFLRREIAKVKTMARPTRPARRSSDDKAFRLICGRDVRSLTWLDLSSLKQRAEREAALLARIETFIANPDPDTRVRDAISDRSLQALIGEVAS